MLVKNYLIQWSIVLFSIFPLGVWKVSFHLILHGKHFNAKVDFFFQNLDMILRDSCKNLSKRADILAIEPCVFEVELGWNVGYM